MTTPLEQAQKLVESWTDHDDYAGLEKMIADQLAAKDAVIGELVDCLDELVVLVDDRENCSLDSFTTQPARAALARHRDSANKGE